MASASNIDDVIDRIDREEQDRLFLRMEQEKEDFAYAQRLQQEQMDTPPRHSNNRGRGGTPRAGTSNRGRGGTPRAGTNNRGRGGTNSRGRSDNTRTGANNQATASTARNTQPGPSNGRVRGRRVLATMAARRAPPPQARNLTNAVIARMNRPPNARRGADRSTTPIRAGRNPRIMQTTRRSTNANALRFDGDRLQARQGGQVVDVTDAAYFPDDDDDSDYDVELDDDQPEDDDVIMLNDSSGSELDMENANRGSTQGIPASTIRDILLHGNLMQDRRTDVNFRLADSDSSEDSDDDESDAVSDLDDTMDEIGPIRAEPNNIDQPIFDEDREMYQRELDLYHDDDEYQVPPPKIPKHKGKPVEPDSTWGDCTMCSNPPIKPQGCKSCLQFLGCADCVRRWHEARQGSMDRPNCPLCRALWTNRGPGVQMMRTIEKHRLKQNKQTASSSGPSSSSAE